VFTLRTTSDDVVRHRATPARHGNLHVRVAGRHQTTPDDVVRCRAQCETPRSRFTCPWICRITRVTCLAAANLVFVAAEKMTDKLDTATGHHHRDTYTSRLRHTQLATTEDWSHDVRSALVWNGHPRPRLLWLTLWRPLLPYGYSYTPCLRKKVAHYI